MRVIHDRACVAGVAYAVVALETPAKVSKQFQVAATQGAHRTRGLAVVAVGPALFSQENLLQQTRVEGEGHSAISVQTYTIGRETGHPVRSAFKSDGTFQKS